MSNAGRGMFEAGLLVKVGTAPRGWPRFGVPRMVPWEAMSGVGGSIYLVCDIEECNAVFCCFKKSNKGMGRIIATFPNQQRQQRDLCQGCRVTGGAGLLCCVAGPTGC